MTFRHVVTTTDELARLYRGPSALVARKKIDHVDAGAAAIIAASPLALLATAGADGSCAVSPRGGAPGFVRVLDPHRLALPDLPGNNLLDAMAHLLENPHAALLFLIPGHEQVLRVAGRACLTTDPEIVPDGARVVVGLSVETVFVHCAASLRRARVWEPESWSGLQAPTTAEVVRGHLALTDPDRAAPSRCG